MAPRCLRLRRPPAAGKLANTLSAFTAERRISQEPAKRVAVAVFTQPRSETKGFEFLSLLVKKREQPMKLVISQLPREDSYYLQITCAEKVRA